MPIVSANLTASVDVILVPQGPEYKAVCRGLNVAQARTPAFPKPRVFSIPVGPQPLTKYLKKWQQAGHLLNAPQPRVLLMGLCGSLTICHSVGDVAICQSCVCRSDVTPLQRPRNCDPDLTAQVHQKLKGRATLAPVLTSDRLVWSAVEKRHLGQIYGAEAVDMEGFAALEVLNQAGIAVAMVRVVSDGCDRDLPDLNFALSPDGTLQSLPLAIGLLRQPIAATRLIRGSLHGLRVLREVTTELFSD